MHGAALTTDPSKQAALPPPSVIKRSIEQAARARLALPVLVILGALGMVVNETTYQHTTSTLDRGIALTDARLEAARTLQALTELEAAARAFLSTRAPADRQRFEQAAQLLPQLQDKALGLVAQVDTQRTIAVDKVRALIDDHTRRLREGVDGAGTGALDSATSRARSADLARELDDVLSKAAALQQTARISLYDAFLLNRGAIHALILFAVLGLVMFARQLRRADAQQTLETERLARLIRERTTELRDLAGHLVRAREDERGRVARELHDEMGGLLTAMKLELARLKRIPELPSLAIERVAGFEKRLNDGIALKRRIVENLRPSSLDQLGLNAALQLLCADTAAVSGLDVQTQLEPVAVDKEAELSLFRIVQESLTNILKYAQATMVEVGLKAEAGWAELTVQDDGQGFDPSAVGLARHGIRGMRLRIEAHGGSLQVTSAAGSGTRVVARLPVAAASPP
jgi:signal transduction histidine kinase